MDIFAKGQVCPMCSQNFFGTSLKYHIKPCARQKLANLLTCQHCGRPCQKEDLPEHETRCQVRMQNRQRAGLSNEEMVAMQERTAIMREALAKVEAGQLVNLDSRGCFMCSVCGQQGFNLLEIVKHEESCRAELARNGCVARPPPASTPDPSPTGASEPGSAGNGASGIREGLWELRQQVLHADEAVIAELLPQGGLPEEQAREEMYGLCLDRIKDVLRNANEKDEKKFRRLRCSNAAFVQAIGRWSGAVRILKAVGFQEVFLASKTAAANGGEATEEPHLVLAEKLPDADLQDAMAVFDAGPGGGPAVEAAAAVEVPPASSPPMPVTAASGGYPADPATAVPEVPVLTEECPYCKRRFRFDRVAKHETRCRAGKPKPSRVDVVGLMLGGCDGEMFIPQAREMIRHRLQLPPLTQEEQALQLQVHTRGSGGSSSSGIALVPASSSQRKKVPGAPTASNGTSTTRSSGSRGPARQAPGASTRSKSRDGTASSGRPQSRGAGTARPASRNGTSAVVGAGGLSRPRSATGRQQRQQAPSLPAPAPPPPAPEAPSQPEAPVAPPTATPAVPSVEAAAAVSTIEAPLVSEPPVPTAPASPIAAPPPPLAEELVTAAPAPEPIAEPFAYSQPADHLEHSQPLAGTVLQPEAELPAEVFAPTAPQEPAPPPVPPDPEEVSLQAAPPPDEPCWQCPLPPPPPMPQVRVHGGPGYDDLEVDVNDWLED
eukprot:TRINITY_DN20863_c0_g1_i1.p1 TRINITY_DN20863_c0_g1~~TRINITY_DN20863_c0_g1_i1.p1  ORF type:complete len:719 (+),score=158.74 TRINITY_DN20863_c0_g1_i1:112-2268(+)